MGGVSHTCGTRGQGPHMERALGGCGWGLQHRQRPPPPAPRPPRSYGFNMRVIKELALAEPLVDSVNPDQVVASEDCLKTFDITTMRKEDATFTAPFALKCNKNDYVHALVRGVGGWGGLGVACDGVCVGLRWSLAGACPRARRCKQRTAPHVPPPPPARRSRTLT